MEYHYFTIEDVEMLKFNGITHLHNHLNYLIHTDKDQKFTYEDSIYNFGISVLWVCDMEYLPIRCEETKSSYIL